MRKVIFYLILIFITLPAYAEDASVNAVDSYVHQVVKDGSAILNNPNLSQEAKTAQARTLILANLDFDWMAKFTLGSYRTSLTKGQIAQFVEVYTKYVTKA